MVGEHVYMICENMRMIVDHVYVIGGHLCMISDHVYDLVNTCKICEHRA